MNKKYLTYAGIGSRATPPEVLSKMQEIAKFLAKKGFILRSGGADGADYDGFEVGCDKVNGEKEIYLPWLGFNGSNSNLLWTQENWDLASQFHPHWNNLKLGARQLMARNSAQILGAHNDRPCDFVICWTEGGQMKGGTAQALRIAKHYKVKIFNLGEDKDLDKLRKFCKSL